MRFDMRSVQEAMMATVAAAALAANIVAVPGPALAQTDEASGAISVRYQPRASGHARQPSRSQSSGDIYQSNAQGHQSYPNPDRDYFGGQNTQAEY
jgi:hypothetical protein